VEGLTLSKVQELMKQYYFERDLSRGLHATFTWLVEEVGELADAILSNDRSKIEEEFADVLAWLASLANLINVDIEECFRKKYLSSSGPPQ